MKSSRRVSLPWDAVAGAGMAMPALAHNIHVLTAGQATTFYCPVFHSLGIQPHSAVLAKFVDPFPIPLMIRPAAGSVITIDRKAMHRHVHRDLPAITAKKADPGKCIQESTLEDLTQAPHRPNPEQAGTFAWKE